MLSHYVMAKGIAEQQNVFLILAVNHDGLGPQRQQQLKRRTSVLAGRRRWLRSRRPADMKVNRNEPQRR